MHKVNLKVGQKFLAIMKHGFNEGKVAHGCPFKCEKVRAINSCHQGVHAIDKDGNDRLFNSQEFEFKAVE